MAVNEKHILSRLYFVAGALFVFALLITIQLVKIQFVEGDQYRELAQENTLKNFVIPANRGNVYADDGSLLATSVPKYEIRFDAVTVSNAVFEENLVPLSKELAKMLGKTPAYYQQRLRKARQNKNRYLLIARNLGYSDYVKIKGFPMFEKGPFKGGIIVDQSTRREHPLGEVGRRTIGYERTDENGFITRIGLEGAYGSFLRGKEGRRMKQKIAKGQWKPLSDDNEIEPQDGFDVVTTINVNIQDIAHHALLRQLEYYEAEHGCVIVMDVKTGAIKAVSNLGRTSDGKYYEAYNYAVGEAHEPGSTFKVMAFAAALEDQVIDTSTVVETGRGAYTFYGRRIRDSKTGGYGTISAARALEVSSNIGLARLIDENYKDDPERFIKILEGWNLDKPIGISILGEGSPDMPKPGNSKWSRNALPSMAYGYGLTLTPLQTLTFYNAIANDGVMVKPYFISEVRTWNRAIETFEPEVINPAICSKSTISKVQAVLENVVKRGTGDGLYSDYFSMAGKTGTAQTEYWESDWEENKRYISSFAGYFPADDPKYSCIVIIHKPSTKKGYYGADVSGPVFKRIAQKIYTDVPVMDEVKILDEPSQQVAGDFEKYYAMAQKAAKQVPNVKGMAGMDAVALLENMGLEVILIGNGNVIQQSIDSGTSFREGQKITLTLS